MSLMSYYAQRCPACQKMLSIGVEALGFNVVCGHCKAEFIAKDDAQSPAALEDPISFWLRFTDQGKRATSEPALPSFQKTLLKKSVQRRPK